MAHALLDAVAGNVVLSGRGRDAISRASSLVLPRRAAGLKAKPLESMD